MRDHDDRLSEPLIQDHAIATSTTLGILGVEIPCRLIGEQDSRLIHHGAGDRDALLFASG